MGIFELDSLDALVGMTDLPDITRLRAALDVALTTLDSCSRPNSAAPSPAPAPPQPRRILESETSNNAAQEFQNDLVIPAVVSGSANVSPVGPVADEGSSRDELIPQQQTVRTVPVASEPVVNVQSDQNLVERGARQEKRIKELEEHILR